MIGKLIDRLDSFFGRLHFRYLGLGALLACQIHRYFGGISRRLLILIYFKRSYEPLKADGPGGTPPACP